MLFAQSLLGTRVDRLDDFFDAWVYDGVILLVGQTIPLGVRIVSACDAWDAMITTRPYRKAMSAHDALAELRRCSGTQFDPVVVRALCAEVDGAHEAARSAAAA